MSSKEPTDKIGNSVKSKKKNPYSWNLPRSIINKGISSKDRSALYVLKTFAKSLRNNVELPDIDANLRDEMRSECNLDILFQNLELNSRLLPADLRKDYSSKHFSAICGCYVEVFDSKAPIVEAVNESAEIHSLKSEVKYAKSDEPPSSPRLCRYCKSAIDTDNVTCNDCRRFLNDFCVNLDRLEYAFCIKKPTCITAESMSEGSISFPKSWCNACKVLHSVNLGFRPYSHLKRKARHPGFLSYFYPSRLPQEENLVWARNKRCVEYFANRIKCEISTELHSFCEFAPFFDRLWCRALSSNANNDDSSCKLCSTSCPELYGITLGPMSTVDSSVIKACEACILRCRTVAIRVAEKESSAGVDSLCKWYASRAEGNSELCECSSPDSKCDFCFTAESIKLLHERLKSIDAESSKEMIPLGSPLFFGCCRPLPKNTSKEDREIESRLIHENLPCVVCQIAYENMLRLNNKTVVCEDCTLAYKTVLTLLMARAKEHNLSDLSLLAILVALPCKNSHHPIDQSPLWAVCLPCHARRCLRLLHPLEPSLDWPTWLKRRAQLVFYRTSSSDKTVTLCDLDPTISLTLKEHKHRKRLFVVTDLSAKEKVIGSTVAIPIPVELTLPETFEEGDSSFISLNSPAPSSIYTDSEPDSEHHHEEKENMEKLKRPASPTASSIISLRDRKSRRLTSRYAEALKEKESSATASTIAKRRRPVDGSESIGTHRSLGSPTMTISTVGEEDEEDRPRPSKRQKLAESPEVPVIVEGKRKPKANAKYLQGDFVTLDSTGKWESSGVAFVEVDDIKSDVSPEVGQNRKQNRRQSAQQPQPIPGRTGPRVKMVNRKPPPSNQLTSPMSIMKHAAKLAAVGAQKQDGTSPFMAASAATAEAYMSDTNSVDGGNRLKADCGNCAACRGLATPCGRCVNCRKQAHYGGVGSSTKNRPCIATICQRRRHLMASKVDGPRVKIPSKFSPRSYQKSNLSRRNISASPGLGIQPSLFDTVPGLEDQIMNIASPLLRSELTPSKTKIKSITTPIPVADDPASDDENFSEASVSLSNHPAVNYPTRCLDVYADAPARSLRGGDLGMYFEPRDSAEDDAAFRSVVPVEGEVIDAYIAHRGGFPVITTSAAAPPKEICYLCGSAGVDLQYCRICAEPYHAFCDRFQSITKGNKKNFVCSNCIPCKVCNIPGVELRCTKCLHGYHPACLSGYTPARNRGKGKFVCPHCTECVHCLVTPYGDYPEKMRLQGDKELIVAWSRNPSKCADCAKAEAKGEVCPVCHRAYGTQPLELIRCDSCEQWMHTSCAQFSIDQFELMRLYPKKLRNYVILCTACELNQEKFLKKTKGDKKKLCQLMSSALTARLNTLVNACAVQSSSSSYYPPHHQYIPSSGASSSTTASRRSFAQGSPPEYTASSYRYMHQMDGMHDDDDDDFQHDQQLEPEMEGGAYEEELEEGGVEGVEVEFHPTDEQMSELTSQDAYLPSWLQHDELVPPPARADWLLSSLGEEFWITPKTLAFILLARVISKLERNPPSTSDYMFLRKLLHWLANSIHTLFPWLDASATVKEVRSILHQRKGSLPAVEEFLRSAAEIELYQLACPFVNALACQIHRMNIFQANQSAPPRKFGFYQTCIEKVRQHISKYHTDFSRLDRSFETAQEVFTQHRMGNADCCSPAFSSLNIHSDQIVSDATTDETLISNFQKELFLKWQRQLHCPSRRAVLEALLDGRTMPYYFAIKSNWEALNDTYASQMVPISSKSTVDLDESDSEAPDVKIRALPEEIIDQEENVLFDPSVEPRRCLLCARHTDASIEDRLIYIGSDTWVHVNCALWSKEVFEEDSGQLTGLSAALRRGSRSLCKDCGRPGATMSCSNTSSCDVVVHFPCALSRWMPTHSRPVFTAGRSFFCSPECFDEAKATRFEQSIKALRSKTIESLYKHDEEGLEREMATIKEDKRGADELIAEWEISQEEIDSIRSEIEWEMSSPELREMLVYRRVFVPSDCFVVSLRDDGFDRNEEQEEGSSVDETDDHEDEDRKAAKRPSVLSLAISVNTLAFASYKLPASAFVVTIGSLHIDRLGRIAEASDSLCRDRPNFLCPVGYRARRFYWSATDPNVLEPFTLTISQAPKDSVKTNDPPSVAPPICPTTSYQRALLPNFVDSRPSSVYTPIASKPLEPVTKLLPSLCSEKNRPATASASYSLAYDPRPSNPTGLPLIRFTYTQGTTPNRAQLKTPISPQQLQQQTQQQQNASGTIYSTYTQQQQLQPQTAIYQPSNAAAAARDVSSSAQPITFIVSRQQPVVSSPPRVKPVNVVNANSRGSVITSMPSVSSYAGPVVVQNSPYLMLTKSSVQPVQVGTAISSNVSLHPRATLPKIVGAVSLSKPSTTQRQQSPTTTTASGVTSITSTPPPTSSPATVVSSSESAVQMPTPTISGVTATASTPPPPPTSSPVTVFSSSRSSAQVPTAVDVVQKPTILQTPLSSQPSTSTAKRPVNVYQSIPSGSVVRVVTTSTSSTTPSQVRRPSFVVRTPLATATARGPALRPVRLFTSASKPLVIGAVDAPTTAAHRLIRPPIVTPRIVRPSGPISVVPSTTVTPVQPSVSQEENSETPASSQPQIRQLDGLDDSDEFISMPQRRVGTGKSAPQKRKWMAEQESKRALQESVQKARQVANERLYQKEVSLFVNSFQLIFTAKASKEIFFTPTAAWRDVVSTVADARRARNIPFSVPPLIDGWAQFGLSNRHVIFLLEQLPGAHTCLRYHFRYHRYRIDQIREKYEPPQANLRGAARLIPYEKDPKRSEMARDPLAFLMCKANRAPRSCLPLDWPGEKNGRSVRGGGGGPESLPSSSTTVAVGRFPSACIDAARQAASIVANSLNISPRLHARTVEAVVAEATADMVEEAEAGRSKQLASLTHQLRNIPTSREARMWRVAVCPSRIHKRGLFALCSFRPGELICEYTGELVSNMVCDKREAMYRAKGVDCYFFRVSENLVVDATYAGNYARFINHSCQPNCGAQIVGKNHIVITASRRILPGEELTYDYQFPKEAEKLSCNCGRIGCKRYLN